VNIMTLGGMALAIGVLVDVHCRRGKHRDETWGTALAASVDRGVRSPSAVDCNALRARRIRPAFFMTGTAKPCSCLALAVDSMIASYLLASTLVPILVVWLGSEPANQSPMSRQSASERPGRPRPSMRWVRWRREAAPLPFISH
jgi:hypothetical protein